jgi:hypothetical protein
LEIIRLVEQSSLPVRHTLTKLGMPRATFYRWYDRYSRGGPEALNDRPPRPDRVWNRIPDGVRENLIQPALDEPALSPRELAVRFTDTESYFVSEASVYRLLKARDLTASPAFIVIKAADAFKDRATAPNQLWQVARELGRTASTVSRELRRNAATRSDGLEYRATTAQWHADRAGRRPKQAKLAHNAALRTYVEERFSPRSRAASVLLKARPPRAGSRSTEVIVDHLDGRPPQLTGPIGQAVLSSMALEIVHDLNGCRLADVDDSLARKVLRRDLRHALFLPTVQARHRFRQQHSQLLDCLGPLDIAEADALRRLLEQIPLCTRPMLGHQLLPRGSHSPGRRLRQSPGTLVNREAARSRDAESARP